MMLKKTCAIAASAVAAMTAFALPTHVPVPAAHASSVLSRSAAIPGCADLPGGYVIYTPWGGSGGPSSNGSVQDGGYAYGQGDHTGCNSSTNSNDYYAVDYSLKSGDAVYPTTGGVVAYAGPATGGWCSLGNIVYVTFTQGLSAVYAHLSQIYVSQGNAVSSSTAIGAAGDTDNCGSTSVHLHTAVYHNANFQYSGSVGPYGGESVRPEPITAQNHGNVYSSQYVGEFMWN